MIDVMGLFSPFISYVFRDTVRSTTLLALILTVLAAASAAILLTLGVLEGFRTMLADGERGWLGEVVVSPREGDASIRTIDEIENRLLSLPTIEAFATRSSALAGVQYKEEISVPLRTIGIVPANEKKVTWLATKVIEGEYFSDSHSTDEVLLGKTLADVLVGIEDDGRSVHVGDTVTVLATDGTRRSMRVRGILDGKNFSPNEILYLQKSDLERIDAGSRNSQIVIKLKPDVDPVSVRSSLQSEFPTVVVRTWDEESQYVRDIIKAVTFIMTAIRVLLIVTIFLVISIIIFIDVNQKRRQIGILKSMGASDTFIISAYLSQALVYAVVGTSIGSALFLVADLWSGNHPIPLIIGDFQLLETPGIFVQTVIAVFVSALVGALFPSWIAAKSKIIDDMRGNV